MSHGPPRASPILRQIVAPALGLGEDAQALRAVRRTRDKVLAGLPPETASPD